METGESPPVVQTKENQETKRASLIRDLNKLLRGEEGPPKKLTDPEVRRILSELRKLGPFIFLDLNGVLTTESVDEEDHLGILPGVVSFVSQLRELAKEHKATIAILTTASDRKEIERVVTEIWQKSKQEGKKGEKSEKGGEEEPQISPEEIEEVLKEVLIIHAPCFARCLEDAPPDMEKEIETFCGKLNEAGIKIRERKWRSNDISNAAPANKIISPFCFTSEEIQNLSLDQLKKGIGCIVDNARFPCDPLIKLIWLKKVSGEKKNEMTPLDAALTEIGKFLVEFSASQTSQESSAATSEAINGQSS